MTAINARVREEVADFPGCGGLFGVQAFIHAMRYGGWTLDGADTDDAPLECQAHQVGRVVRWGVVQDMAVMRIRGAQTRERCPSIS